VYYKSLLKAGKDADAIFALDPVSVGLPAMEAAKKLKMPFFVKVVGDYAWEQGVQRFGVTASLDEFVLMKKIPFAVAFFRFVESKVTTFASRVIVPSQYLKGVIKTWGVPEEKIEVISNAVSIDAPTEVSHEQQLPRPRIVSVGRLVPWKGMLPLIDAIASLRANGCKASLTIIGEGEEGELLKKHAKELLTDGYSFPGRLSHVDTLAIIKNADVFVLNSTYEGLSHLLIEAITLGTPVVATEAGGNTEVITDGVNGLTIGVGDTASLTKALSRIIEDSALRAKLSVGAKESSKRFSTSSMLHATHKVLTSNV
jgi:glycosyltransferase involved in cell wall biosynthesis